MTTSYLTLTAYDPVVARDGRPFGIGQGNRMRGLGWPYPSVVAGSFRTALVKATPGRDFSGEVPRELLAIPVAGVFPVHQQTLYLPAPADCVVHPTRGPLALRPQGPRDGGCDFPIEGLWPVTLSEEQAPDDFKPVDAPAWWPVEELARWLTGGAVTFGPAFLGPARPQVRDHVQIDPAQGAAAEGLLFTTAGLNLTHLPRFGVKDGPRANRFATITLTARVGCPLPASLLHPLGGERRLVHWAMSEAANHWQAPVAIRDALRGASRARMVLASPAIFEHGWRPAWVSPGTLEGTPPGTNVRLRLVGAAIGRWKAVSGWSLAPPRGPKPVRRLVPAGGVYFFDALTDPAPLAERWLQPVSDSPQDCTDGFGLALWGTW